MESSQNQNLVEVLKIKARKDNNATVYDTDTEDSESEVDEKEAIQSRNEAGERIIKKIEKWSVIVYLIAWIISLVTYWWIVLEVYPGDVENGKIIQISEDEI